MSRRCLPTAASLSRHHLRFLRAIHRTHGGLFPLWIERDQRTAERLSPLFVTVHKAGRAAALTDAGRAALVKWWQS